MDSGLVWTLQLLILGLTRLSLCLDTETRSLGLVLVGPGLILLSLCLETKVLLGPDRDPDLGPDRGLSPGLGPEGVRTSEGLFRRMIFVRLRSLNPALPSVSTAVLPVSMATAADPVVPSILRGALHLNLLRPLGLTEAFGLTGFNTGLGLRGLGFSLDPGLGLDSALCTLETHWYLEEGLPSTLTRLRLIGMEPEAPVAASTSGRSLPLGLSEPARTQVNLDRSRIRTEAGLSVFVLFTVSEETPGAALFTTV